MNKKSRELRRKEVRPHEENNLLENNTTSSKFNSIAYAQTRLWFEPLTAKLISALISVTTLLDLSIARTCVTLRKEIVLRCKGPLTTTMYTNGMGSSGRAA